MRKIEGTLTALTPVHHGGNEKTGVESTLNRVAFFIDGRQEEIPIVSGNSIRGKFRRRLARDFLTRLGFEGTKNPLKSKRLYHLVFAGGGGFEQVRDADRGTINLNARRDIRRWLVVTNLLGGSLGNQPFESIAKTGFALPVCTELVNSGFIPKRFAGKKTVSFYELLSSQFGTHKDDLRNRDEDDPAVQMLYTHETFVPGTVFYHKWILYSDDPVVLGAFWRGVKLFKEDDPYIGGGFSTNFGEVAVNYEGYDEKLDEPYLEFLDAHKSEITEYITELGKTWR